MDVISLEMSFKKGDKAAALEEYKILKRFDAGMAEMLFVRIY